MRRHRRPWVAFKLTEEQWDLVDRYVDRFDIHGLTVNQIAEKLLLRAAEDSAWAEEQSQDTPPGDDDHPRRPALTTLPPPKSK